MKTFTFLRLGVASMLLLLASAGPLHAEEAQPATGTVSVTYRVTGLFSPDREADLKASLEQQLPDIQLASVDYPHGEAAFRYDPALAFKGVKPADILKRFDEKLRTASSGTFGIQPRFTIAPEKLVRVEIPVVGLDCKACSFAAYETVAKLEGVAQATASFREGLVTALIDPGKTNKEALEEALRKKQILPPAGKTKD
ncbi:MAG TPA: heavy metal-associated domain-containing protein [Verrucomicrobium sp.]|nr:heavy metal-associated domain-containing protein [Verrucomicrobium sp.]